MRSANINVQDAIAAANQVAPKRFSLFLGRILEGMIALKSAPSDLFSSKELDQLIQVLNADTLAQVKLLINFCVYVLNRLAFLRN